MAGFYSPLFVLGIGTTAIKRGFRTPIPVLNMGTGAPAANEVGFRTPLPFWNAGATEFIPPEPEVRRGGGNSWSEHHSRILREDEDILAVIMAYMETKH